MPEPRTAVQMCETPRGIMVHGGFAFTNTKGEEVSTLAANYFAEFSICSVLPPSYAAAAQLKVALLTHGHATGGGAGGALETVFVA